MNKSVLQDWVCDLPFMQQALLCVALRGPALSSFTAKPQDKEVKP